jgi:hypothetical protein
VGSFPHTFSHSWVAFLAYAFPWVCLGCEPKAKVVTHRLSICVILLTKMAFFVLMLLSFFFMNLQINEEQAF